MRFFIIATALGLIIFCVTPAEASLAYYNQDLGYTIWLPKSWAEASDSYLDWAEQSRKPVPVQGDSSNWKAGYCNPTDGYTRSLLVEVKPGRRMHAADISNFNRFIVKTMSRMSSQDMGKFGSSRVVLKDAAYFKDKKILRLRAEMTNGEQTVLSLTYVVYTRTGMLTFVGYVDPADDQARQIIDTAVFSLYLDDNMRY
ncbi:MAG: hypothetical protein JEY79_17175 [Pseudodesulfovibrio sp.]|nr:hypothetical protein [Pseudodesulfovibrio sp.]